jgi:hypothetical protein
MELNEQETEFLIRIIGIFKRATSEMDEKAHMLDFIIGGLERMVGKDKLADDEQYLKMKSGFEDTRDKYRNDVSLANGLLIKLIKAKEELQPVESEG